MRLIAQEEQPAMDFSADPQHTLTLNGFDIRMYESDQGESYLWVELYENGSKVFEKDVPLPSNEGTDVLEDFEPRVAQTAIDLFEAERGTLGQGAGAMEVQACLDTYLLDEHENWFMTFKGTPYEESAYSLLKELYAAGQYTEQDRSTDALYKQLHEIEDKLKLLNLERMKNCSANTKVIIVQAAAKRSYFGGAEAVQSILDKFAASPYETEVAKLVSSYIEIEERLKQSEKNVEGNWKKQSEIRDRMEALSIQYLQSSLAKKMPTSGLEAYPEMGQAITELLQGVEMDPVLDAFNAPSGAPDPFTNVPNVFASVIEKGKKSDGLDYAERGEKKFCKGDKVSLSKKFDVSTSGGLKLSLPKNTKGYIENVFDGSGDDYMVRLEDFGTLILPVEILS